MKPSQSLVPPGETYQAAVLEQQNGELVFAVRLARIESWERLLDCADELLQAGETTAAMSVVAIGKVMQTAMSGVTDGMVNR